MKHLNIRTMLVQACLLTASAQLCLGDQLLELAHRGVAAGPAILLRDIVKNSRSLPNGWADRVVMDSPKLGTPAEYSLTSIATALQKYPDMQDVVLRGRIKIKIERKGTTISSNKVIEAVRSHIDKSDRWKNMKIDLQMSPIDSRTALPTDVEQITVQGCSNGSGPYRYVFNTLLQSKHGETARIDVHARITPLQDVWTAQNTLPRGHRLSTHDVYAKSVPIDSAARFIPTSELVAGQELNRLIRKDQPLNRHYLAQPLCAKRGDSISVTAERSALSINMRAKAMAQGRLGDSIYCMNERSKRRLLVKLTGSREATVDF